MVMDDLNIVKYNLTINDLVETNISLIFEYVIKNLL